MTKILPTGNSRSKSSIGFSLIELLVVLTIVSVLVSSISYVVIDRRQTLKTVSQEIVQNLRRVRQQSIRDDRPYQVKIDLASNTIRFIDDKIELAADVSVTVRTAQHQLIDSDVAGMTFYPDASASGGDITLETDTEIFEISVVWISGKVLFRHELKPG